MIYQSPYRNGSYTKTCDFGKSGSWSCGWHCGVDLVGDSKNIFPICSGTVQALNTKGDSYGNHILIKQDDGRVSLYAHLSEINVSVGDTVSLNTCIGVEGSTGNSTGSHLHLELHDDAYKYPTGYTSTTATWLHDAIEEIELNQSLSTEESTKIIMEKAGLEQKTIGFLQNYKYCDALVQKLAVAICKKTSDSSLTDSDTVMQTAGLESATITFMLCYKYDTALMSKLACAMR